MCIRDRILTLDASRGAPAVEVALVANVLDRALNDNELLIDCLPNIINSVYW